MKPKAEWPMLTSKNNLIHIGADWALKGSSLCVSLQKRHISEKGKEYWTDEGYYNDFHDAYRAMINKGIGPLNNVEKIIKAIDNLYEFAAARLISGR
jgi:hypothetical protein